jgi:hypothetical protein
MTIFLLAMTIFLLGLLIGFIIPFCSTKLVVVQREQDGTLTTWYNNTRYLLKSARVSTIDDAIKTADSKAE